MPNVGVHRPSSKSLNRCNNNLRRMSRVLRLKVSDNPKGNSTLIPKISRKAAKTPREDGRTADEPAAAQGFLLRPAFPKLWRARCRFYADEWTRREIVLTRDRRH